MNWQTDLRNAIDGFTQDVEALVDEISRDAMGALDRFVELSDDFMDDLTATTRRELETPTPIANFLDRDLEEFLNSLLRPFIDLSIEDVNYSNSSMPKAHVLCEKCENYHGQSYGGTQLVCGIHPYGPDVTQTECGDRFITPTGSKLEENLSNFPPDWWNS